jgi:DNA-binding transcriptional MerR regulator
MFPPQRRRRPYIYAPDEIDDRLRALPSLPKPARTGGNYRAYGQAELGRLSFIRRSRDLGFSLDQVRALLRLSGDSSCDCAGIDRIAREHLLEVDRKLADLAAMRRELKSVIDSCDGGVVADCRIIEALAPMD